MKAVIRNDASLILDTEEISYANNPSFRRHCYKKWLVAVQGKSLEVNEIFPSGNCNVICPKTGFLFDVKKTHIDHYINY